jgi:ketosteroid isomerase-like protein
MNLPLPVQTFFDADARDDGDALAGAFAPDAVVTDEGQSHAGRKAIEMWWRESKATTQHRNAPLDVAEKGGTTEVRARVTGQFPGSPAMLTFAFRLEGDQIVALEIRV